MLNLQGLAGLIGMIQNSGNPLAAIQQIAGNNPAMAQAMRMAQNGNPQEVVNNLCRERGISPEQLRQMAGQFGIKL